MIDTDRLVLRPWAERDLVPFHAMGQDAEVMRYIGPLANWADAESARERMDACQAANGYCFWAVERRTDGAFIGFCGLKPGRWPIEGEMEIGWRLARAAWGQGFAHEAAQASLDWAWRALVPSVTAITVPANARSRGLMERLGMVRYANEDFDHPDVPEGSPLKRHVLYRIARPA